MSLKKLYELKKAVVVPIHNSGDVFNNSNYRPTSLLSSISKVFEQVLHAQLVKFFADNDIISQSQYGFGKGRGTQDALLSLVNTVLNALNKHKKTLAVFLDIRKAFDTIRKSC